MQVVAIYIMSNCQKTNELLSRIGFCENIILLSNDVSRIPGA